VHGRQLRQPFAVVTDFEMLRTGQENLADLRDIGVGVPVDRGAVLLWTKLVAAGGVTDRRGVVTDDQDRLVAPVLELPHDPERHGVAERHVGRGRVHAELDAQRCAGLRALLELLAQVVLGEDALAPTRKNCELLVDWHHADGPTWIPERYRAK